LGRSVSYRTLIRLELYKIEKHIIGEKEYSPFISEW
ncbi:MAG: subtype I-B CRISPR-associated endonuclease Cas1, partial [Candidatus Micrarchaeia archaeon]